MARMRRHDRKAWAYRWATRVGWVAASVFFVVTIFLKLDPTKIEFEWMSVPVAWVQQKGWWFIAIAAALAGATRWVRSWADKPGKWETLKAFLDETRRQAFGVVGTDPAECHRVTLFKYRKWRLGYWPWWKRWYWPWSGGRTPLSGWLMPVLRSGIRTQATESIFNAPDQGHAEGIAGRTWSCENQVIFVDDLPAINAQSSEAEMGAYAQRSGVTLEWVKRRFRQGKVCPLTFLGLPIERRGRLYGVLILDSSRAQNLS